MTDFLENLLVIRGGGMKCDKLHKYSVKKLRDYAIKLKLKITKKQGSKNINICKDELINKIKKKIRK